MRFISFFKSVSILSLLLLAACSSQEEKAANAGNQALQAMQVGDLQRAKLAALEAIGHRDDVAAYWLLLGRISVSMGEMGSAYSAYMRASELDRADPEALLGLAQISLAAGRLKDARDFADQYLLIVPDDSNAALIKGFVSLREKDFAAAQQLADTILARRPGDQMATVLSAQILDETGKSAEGAALLEEAVAARGPNRPMLEALVDIYKKTGNANGVRESYRRMVSLPGADPKDQLAYARFLFEEGYGREGLAFIEPLLGAAQGERLAGLVGAGGGAGLTGADIERLGQGAKPPVRVALAGVAIDVGHPAEAARLVASEAQGEVSAANASAKAILAAAHYAMDRKEEASRLADAVLAFDPTQPRALHARASLAMDRRDLDAALRDAQLLVRDEPKEFRNRLLLAKVYQARGDATLAALTYRKAYGDFPDSKPARLAYAGFLRQSGQVEAAQEIADRSVKVVNIQRGHRS